MQIPQVLDEPILFNPAKFKEKPLGQYQIDGIRFILEHEYGGILDDMGSGKTYQIINAGCILYAAKVIDTILVVCPSSVRTSWKNPEFGEIAKYCWQPYVVGEFSSRNDLLPNQHFTRNKLFFVVTNYELIRMQGRAKQLQKQLKGRRIMMVCDESSYIKSHRSLQTKACLHLRNSAERAFILNGTPVANSPLDLYSQMAFLHEGILGFPNYWTFRNHHAVIVTQNNLPRIVGYNHIEELQTKIKPYVIRREKEDVLKDLPPKSYQIYEVPLSKETWRIYREMRDFMIAWLDHNTTASVTHTITKLLRLNQITSGFVGGIDTDIDAIETSNQDSLFGPRPDFLKPTPLLIQGDPTSPIREISSEKQQWFENWFEDRIVEHHDFRCIAWAKFRAEQSRAARELSKKYTVHRIYGGQKDKERELAISEFTRGQQKGPMILLGNPQAGGLGLNLTTAAVAIYLSNDFNLLTRKQSEDRIHRQGQKLNTLIIDILATGPEGQRTIDHTTHRALRNKSDLAAFTTSAWRDLLIAEKNATS